MEVHLQPGPGDVLVLLLAQLPPKGEETAGQVAGHRQLEDVVFARPGPALQPGSDVFAMPAPGFRTDRPEAALMPRTEQRLKMKEVH